MLITAHAFDVQCEIIGRKSKSHNFRRERELVSAGKHVTPAIAPNDWLSLFAEAQMNWICCWDDVALFHGSDPLLRSIPGPLEQCSKQTSSHSHFVLNFRMVTSTRWQEPSSHCKKIRHWGDYCGYACARRRHGSGRLRTRSIGIGTARLS